MSESSLSVTLEVEQQISSPVEREFAASLEKFGHLPVQDMPQFSDRLSHTGDIATYDPGQALESGLYLRHDIVGSNVGREIEPSSMTYAPQPLADIGRKIEIDGKSAQTHHGTFFGSLRIEGDNPGEIPVAIKPMAHEPQASVPMDRATQELAMLDYVATCGLPTLEVIGMCVDNEATIPTSYILTRRNPELQSLDTLDWTQETANIDEHLRTAVSTLNALHSNLIFHRDLEFKNISSLDSADSIMIFDMEWAVSLRDTVERGGEAGLERLSKAIEFDLGTVQRSIRKLAYPNMSDENRPETNEAQFEYELSHLYEPYHLALMQSDSTYKDVLDIAYRKVLARKRAQLDGTD